MEILDAITSDPTWFWLITALIIGGVGGLVYALFRRVVRTAEKWMNEIE